MLLVSLHGGRSWKLAKLKNFTGRAQLGHSGKKVETKDYLF